MSHEIAKLLLEKAGTFIERTEAVQTAITLGMPLNEIEEYLDWVEHLRHSSGCPNEEPSMGRVSADLPGTPAGHKADCSSSE